MSTSRVYYRERQRLVTADLRQEQDYLLGLAGRHHLSHHQWGVVRGLRIVRTPGGGLALTPGVAIDGYGREILVAEAVPLGTPDLNACHALVIYYCEFDAQVWPDRQCEDRPAPRIAQRFVLMPVDEFLPRDDEQPIENARSAGRFAGSPPWPVLVGRIGEACFADLVTEGTEDPSADETEDEDEIEEEPDKITIPDPPVDYSQTRYVRHRASFVRSPTGRAQLQLGLTSQSDVYRMLLSTRDGATLVRRLAIDRDRVVNVWRPLWITGAVSVAKAMLGPEKILVIKTVTPGGIGGRVRFEGRIDPISRMLRVGMLEFGNQRADRFSVAENSKKFNPITPFNVKLPFAGARIADFRLVNAADKGIPFGRPAARARAAGKKTSAARVQPDVVAFSAEAVPIGGRLLLHRAAAAAAPTAIACGDVDRTRSALQATPTPLVQFRPATEIKSNPLAREIFAVITSKPTDIVPATELRISGGEEDDSDTSGRVAIGSTPAAGQDWMPVVRMDGGRRLDILDFPPTKDPRAVLTVDRTVYLPAIGKKDPLLQDMMAMAFISGLEQMGRVFSSAAGGPTLTVALVSPAPLAGGATPTITRGDTLTYSLAVTNTGGVKTFKRWIEIIIGTSGSGDLLFRTLQNVDTSGATKNVDVPFFTHRASAVNLQVQLLGEDNSGKSFVAFSKPVPLNVSD